MTGIRSVTYGINQSFIANVELSIEIDKKSIHTLYTYNHLHIKMLIKSLRKKSTTNTKHIYKSFRFLYYIHIVNLMNIHIWL